jgi:hypothetical protein
VARTRKGRRAAFIAAVGGISLTSLVVLNAAADALPWQGLRTLRDYAIRRNG